MGPFMGLSGAHVLTCCAPEGSSCSAAIGGRRHRALSQRPYVASGCRLALVTDELCDVADVEAGLPVEHGDGWPVWAAMAFGSMPVALPRASPRGG